MSECKTKLGKRLLAIRNKAIEGGMELLSEDEINALLNPQDALARLTEENERLSDVKRLVQEYPLTAEGMAQLRTRLAAAEEELAELKAWKRAYDESVKAALKG